MKKPFGIKLTQQLAQRLDNLAVTSRIKRNTLIEMCIEEYLPELESKYKAELAKLLAKAAGSDTERIDKGVTDAVAADVRKKKKSPQ